MLFLGFDINYGCEGFDGGSALHIACMNMSYDAAKILLDKGANVGFKNSSGLCPKGQ